MKNRRCRCCKQNVGMMGWASHIEMHKKEFARAIGRVEWEAHNINFEDVVNYFNPDEADKSKCIGYPKPKQTKLIK